MAIRRQNRALYFTLAIILIVLALILRREKKVHEYFNPDEIQENTEISETTTAVETGSQLPAVAGNLKPEIKTTAVSSDRQKAFVEVFEDMTSCLSIKSASYSEKDPIEMDMILSQLQSDLGLPKFNSDLWMNWHLRTNEGKEKRIRIEISSASDEPTIRELRYFNIDREGIPQPVDIDDSKAINPSDETLNQLLKEGEVFYKERAGFYTFANGERLEYVEKNGELSEIEMVRGESIFKCSDVRARENCRCLK